MDEYLEAMEDDLKGAMDALGRDLLKVRTGRASPKLVEDLVVAVASYGANMPLNQLATVQAPDARLLVITPWDKSTISDIEKSIIAAGLGLNPSSDGQVVRIPVPALTKERRQELVKMCRSMGEDIKVRVRHVRREYNDTFKGAEKDGDISEDDMRRLLKSVQELTDKYIAAVDARVSAKEAEVLEV
ncbi:MAG: ribosome recycling factor [Myxococcales bacterium]|nr:ribosome recycling factor [Myxococcales bacterium]